MFQERLFNQGKQRLPTGHARAVGRESRVIGDTFETGHIAEFLELRIIADGKDDMSVLRGEGLIGDDVRVRVAKPPRDIPRHQIVQRLIGKAGDTDIEQAHVDMLPFAGPRGMNQRGEYRRRGIGAGQHVDERNPDFHRHAFGFAGNAHQTAHALDHEVVPGPC